MGLAMLFILPKRKRWRQDYWALSHAKSLPRQEFRIPEEILSPPLLEPTRPVLNALLLRDSKCGW